MKKTAGIFPQRLRELMKKRRLSQSALAGKVGVSRATVARWLAGGDPPGADVFWDVAGELVTSARYLLGRTEDPAPPAYPDEDEREMLEEYRSLKDKAARQAFREMIRESREAIAKGAARKTR